MSAVVYAICTVYESKKDGKRVLEHQIKQYKRFPKEFSQRPIAHNKRLYYPIERYAIKREDLSITISDYMYNLYYYKIIELN